MEELIEKSYDYITAVTICQGRLLDKKTLYGDGSIYQYNKEVFEAVYNAIEQELKNIEK